MNLVFDIKPFVGVGDLNLYSALDTVKCTLGSRGIDFTTEVWGNKECTNPVPWTILRTENGMNLFFAKNKLFKIHVEAPFSGQLPNGVSIGMAMPEAQALDDSLRFDDWEEDWSSDLGYWLEDDPTRDTVSAITVFIREVLDDDLFEQYTW